MKKFSKINEDLDVSEKFETAKEFCDRMDIEEGLVDKIEEYAKYYHGYMIGTSVETPK